MRPRVQLSLLATGLILSANVVRAAVITLTVGPTGQFASINAATSFADTDTNPNNSYEILVVPGTYTNDFSNVTRPMTIEAATPGSQVLLLATVPPPNLKGIIWTDSSLTVNGLTFEGAAIPSSDGGNGAGIRDESTSATSLIVENSTFLNNQEGILTGGSNYQETVQILNSQFINNGNSTDPNGQEHALYVGDAGSLGVSNSLFCGTLLGHDIKSRALSTTVQNSTMYIGAAASPGSPDYNAGCTMPGSTSIGVDIPNGGNADLVGDALIQGPANRNGALVSYGEEGLHSSGANTFAISDSTFTSTANGLAIQELPTCLAQVTLTNDMFTGTSAIINQSNCLIAPEILWQNTSGEAYIWEMNGTNVIGGGSLGNPGPSWKVIATGDFYDNGGSDILWQNSSGEAYIWEMNGTAYIGGGSLGNPGSSWHAIATGDFNGDGYSDILWQNTSGEAYIWEMNGTNMIGSGSLGNPARAGTQSPPAISTAMVIPTSCGRTPAAKPTSGR